MSAALSPLEAYRRWARSWDTDPSPIVALESRSIRPWLDGLRGKLVADLSCGSGRWMAYATSEGAAVIGFDFCREMLLEARRKPVLSGRLVQADTRRLPLLDACADVALCALSLGHIDPIEPAIAELARIVRPGGSLLISDFHPGALRLGWKRTFRNNGQTYEIETHAYTKERLLDCAAHAGLAAPELIEPCFGEAERAIFEQAGKPELYERARGVPAVLAVRWTRP